MVSTDVDLRPTAHLASAQGPPRLRPGHVTAGVGISHRRNLAVARPAVGLRPRRAVNVFGAAYVIALELGGGFQADAGIDGKTWISPPVIAGALLCAAAAAALLRRLPPQRLDHDGRKS